MTNSYWSLAETSENGDATAKAQFFPCLHQQNWLVWFLRARTSVVRSHRGRCRVSRERDKVMNIPTATSFTRPFGKLAGSITFGVLSICFASLSAVQAGFVQTNLVSDIPGLAANTDPNLKNPWGIASSTTSPFW